MTLAELAEQMRRTNQLTSTSMHAFSLVAIPVLRVTGTTMKAFVEAAAFQHEIDRLRFRFYRDPLGMLGISLSLAGAVATARSSCSRKTTYDFVNDVLRAMP